MEQVDVTIVGGGPTGLFTALLLHRLGNSVIVLDEKSTTLDLGRADAMNARTQQYLEVAGILEELLPQGLKCNTSSTFRNGEFSSRQDAWWVSIEHALHKNFLMLGQPVIEAALRARLGDAVRYGEKVATISEAADHVLVTTHSGRRIRSTFALGADGARSLVRQAMGISFTGSKPEMLWAVVDTFIETDFPTCPEIITFELNGQARVAWIPRERGLARFYVLLEGEVNQERAEESIRKHMAPYTINFKKTEWYSTFYVKERIAGSFISKDGEGRVFLGGDAAHVHSVNGGQGLNTGAADAFALAWRLNLALKPTLLRPEAVAHVVRSYDTERRNTARQVIEVAAALVRDTVREAKTYVATIEKNAGFITGMGVTYAEYPSAVVRESEHGIWKAGNRCPDIVLTCGQGKPTRLYSETDYGKFLVLFIGSHHVPTFKYSAVAVPYLITPADSKEEQEMAAEAKQFQADWATADDSLMVVVRPDMYIGYVGADWQAYLDGIFA